MTREKKNNTCRKIRNWLYQLVSGRFGIDADWVQNHIANCPRCQRRMASVGKVNLALSLIKSQPQKLDLLSRANARAIGVLKHSLREAPKAQKLKAAQPEPKLLQRCSKYRHSATNAAACITILFLMKTGVFSSMSKFQAEGQKTMRQYYASQVGQDLADEFFSA
jgi:anti-sigma factor RsiW